MDSVLNYSNNITWSYAQKIKLYFKVKQTCLHRTTGQNR